MKALISSAAAIGLTVSVANAAIILDTSPANDRADLSTQAGQTFTLTTGDGLDQALNSIVVFGPSDAGNAGLTTVEYTLKVWTDLDGNFSTWDPGQLVAESTNTSTIAQNGTGTFNFSQEVLQQGEVYAFSFTTGSGDHQAFRPGLTNVDGIRLTDGALFSGGTQPFGGAYDASFQIDATKVPEPSSAALLGLGGLALILRRRK
ncbi:PEP-CTERM sorting domain-containing protein [Sulfuriroseicoccus oceanibius]|uniref:PEP-CTERM sorting domain-containing protein n=1 Tax=Sulfuriroseicoccus oceanibius TaxID=2707525 RepID=A0A6B3LF17_9BACT|nr:PEP-CTERM sorting domain-containing protein [Sulfuriroseicoccus oceanibius]QQL44942.1 PEP-CTERM sorting domain-containing protein [Sulfuriroseicoccus oceanibius]